LYSEDDSAVMPDTGEEYDFWQYFPLWDQVIRQDGLTPFRLVFPLHPFVPYAKPVMDEEDE